MNVGSGPFEANGSRPNTTVSDLTAFDDARGSTDVPITGTTMFWAGDGHNHWQIRDMESGTLTRLDNGKVVGPSPSMASSSTTGSSTTDRCQTPLAGACTP